MGKLEIQHRKNCRNPVDLSILTLKIELTLEPSNAMC